MFAPLLNYNDNSYWIDHPLVTIVTLDGKCTYQIIVAFYSKAYTSEDTNVFHYYNYIDVVD